MQKLNLSEHTLLKDLFPCHIKWLQAVCCVLCVGYLKHGFKHPSSVFLIRRSKEHFVRPLHFSCNGYLLDKFHRIPGVHERLSHINNDIGLL